MNEENIPLSVGDIITVDGPSVPKNAVGVKFRVTSVEPNAIGIEVADRKEAKAIYEKAKAITDAQRKDHPLRQ